ncbi:hypothetical protein LTR28_007880 [Elasticomyces elasticus]|nr:hypothetical protein LTR28_007880 [Elasticomyces elasticus]
MGRHDVKEGEDGMYGLVFDNTFSKQASKNVTFVLMTHPTNAPPKSGNHLHYSQAFASNSAGVGGRYSPSFGPVSDSTESLPQEPADLHAVLDDPRPRSRHGQESKSTGGSSFYTGVLHKKRRKRAQGYARRFFSLDFTSSTLSYYRNRHSSALRGSVPLSLAAIGANEETREFSIDSGAEVWHLKANNKKDFEAWRAALERAAVSAVYSPSPMTPRLATFPPPSRSNPAEEREWERVEELLARVSGTRDAVRLLAKDTDPKYLPLSSTGVSIGSVGTNTPSPVAPEPTNNPFFKNKEDDDKLTVNDKANFWKRKGSSCSGHPSGLFRRSVSAQAASPSPSGVPSVPLLPAGISPLDISRRLNPQPSHGSSDEVHERCMAILRDLDAVVADFSALIGESRARRLPALQTSMSRLSIDSVDEEFFDAEDGARSPGQLLIIRHDSHDNDERNQVPNDITSETGSDSESSSDAGDHTIVPSALGGHESSSVSRALFSPKPKSLTPLPMYKVQRRTTIAPPKQAPPSILGFLKKNAGKDLSTVSMPVSSNEPISLLQRLAEGLEYTHLLDSAASLALSSQDKAVDRLAHIAAFAVSGFASNRVKERALRKPFNPLLGETYELVREDLGFRFVAEKVSHHPVKMACQAESLAGGGWAFAQSPRPVQKFWGKSVELNTEGRARLVLYGAGERDGGERYSWNQATCFLRNILAGEKYVEPVQSMTIVNESTGAKAVATFKAGGMFSGRSEDVSVVLFGPGSDTPLPAGLGGKWTESLHRTDTGETIWTVGALVPNASKVYGFTAFAAALNQITPIEDGRLPHTDSRLRPDQQALEAGDLDRAEGLKARLEERQRARRKVLETHGHGWAPRFFEKVDGGKVGDGDGEAWTLRSGKDGYWERRERRDWNGVEEVFEL